jgi:hypothetical protein
MLRSVVGRWQPKANVSDDDPGTRRQRNSLKAWINRPTRAPTTVPLMRMNSHGAQLVFGPVDTDYGMRSAVFKGPGMLLIDVCSYDAPGQSDT